MGAETGLDYVGWDLMTAGREFISKRVQQGTPAYRVLKKRKLEFNSGFLADFPSWPKNDFVPPYGIGGMPLEEAD